ncbi:af1a38af-3046-4fa3-bfae-7c9db5c40625 [Sclerotinia trifoliorum]|uniref:Af1a38af-3046-4fa3-bfae-7c9db5c40625 n=1 Tax=Sclerotinia trifoliorum TaxID=28548 RepID=A0A8H2VUD3_9HELO|nr:af1a38af-3046-4fa3-bfae-7c9db5c40625 [Sclerotinia trifoliorum]
MNLASNQSYCAVEIQDEKTRGKVVDDEKENSRLKIFLCVIFYGVIEAFEDVDEFFQECQIQEEPVTTASTTYESITGLAGNVNPQIDLFAVLRNEDNIEEVLDNFTKTLKASTQIYVAKRIGVGFGSSRSDIWSREGSLYFNTVNRETQLTPPPDFRGGLLADEMGLGKALAMIALIALNPIEPEIKTENVLVISRGSIKTTLIIAPLSFKPSIDVLSGYDIVLTTYETIAAQINKFHKSNSVEEIIYSVTCHRVIQDEAHIIRNRRTSRAKSVCTLPRSNLKCWNHYESEFCADKTKSSSSKSKGLQNGEKCHLSYWTFTLDLIEYAIRSFQTTNHVRVILVSITCGGVGLELTAASRAYLMEPQWNPQMEEQALCRVYRLGQKKDVTTIRYRILDSFEENVVTIQDWKKELANLTFSNAKLSEKDVEAGRLQYLRAALK